MRLVGSSPSVVMRPSCGGGAGRARVRGASPNAPPACSPRALFASVCPYLLCGSSAGSGVGRAVGVLRQNPSPRARPPPPFYPSLHKAIAASRSIGLRVRSLQRAALVATLCFAACGLSPSPLLSPGARVPLASLASGSRRTPPQASGYAAARMPWLSATCSDHALPSYAQLALHCAFPCPMNPEAELYC